MYNLAGSILKYTEALNKYINQQLRKGPGKTPSLESLLAMAWYIVRSNTAWLSARYNNRHELTWQIVSTLRLVYETTADINYLVKRPNSEDIAKRIVNANAAMKTSEDMILKMQDKNFRRKVSIGSTTEERIQEEYGSTEGGMYAICCLFTHFNFFGAQLAYDFENPEKDPNRQLAVGSLPDLLYRCSVAFSRVELFEGIQGATKVELQKMKKLAQANSELQL